MNLSPGLIKFLAKVGERNAYAVKDSGRPTPEAIYDQFKVLSMLEVLLRDASKESLSQVEQISNWSPS